MARKITVTESLENLETTFSFFVWKDCVTYRDGQKKQFLRFGGKFHLLNQFFAEYFRKVNPICGQS